MNHSLNIVLLEPFFTGSHKAWAEGYAHHSRHRVQILSLPGKYWKWRMHGGAVALAKQFNELDQKTDLILATSMLDLTTFLALTRHKSAHIPTAIYFHENQLTYPWSPTDAGVKLNQNFHYAFINYVSALAADKVLFNSAYHQNSFLEALPAFLKIYPDQKGLDSIDKIKQKSEVLHLGMDLSRLDQYKVEKTHSEPVILWNHRWEYDKNPKEFFEALYVLSERELSFKLIVLGENYAKHPPIFAEAQKKLKSHIIHFGYAPDFETYAHLLWQADILPVTSHQDFFGGSIVEAIYCNAFPLLPRRLAYPEHIPTKHHTQHFYKNNVEFIKKLDLWIRNFDENRVFIYRKYVKNYDWSQSIHQYDDLMTRI